jgi:hypothetical protein
MISPLTTSLEELMMRSDLVVSLVASILLILLLLLSYWLWHRAKTVPLKPKSTRLKRNSQPFAGLTRKPECALCEQGQESHVQISGALPPRMHFT